MRPTERDLMVARAVRDACFVAADNIDGIDLAALIESLPEHDERPRCRCGWVSVEGGEIIDPFCPVHDVPVEHEQAAHTPNSEAPHHPACTRSFDARDWARDFRETAKSLGYCDMDEGWLIGWFANAIMRGFDEAEQHREQPAPDVRP